jgi:hypothetical protein
MPLIVDDAKKMVIIKYANKPEPLAYRFKDIDCVLIRNSPGWEGHKSVYLITKGHREHFIKAATPDVVEGLAKDLARMLDGLPVLNTADDGTVRPLPSK